MKEPMKGFSRWLLSLTLVMGGMCCLQDKACAKGAVSEVQTILAKHTGTYTTPPSTVGALDPNIKGYRVPDGPLMGNGDMAVAVGGTYTNQTFYLSKSDLSQSARGLGGLTFTFDEPAVDGTKYRQEQDLYHAEVRSVIPLRKTTVRMRSWTADTSNILVTELWIEGGVPLEVNLKLWSHANASTTQAGAENGIIWSTREITNKLGTPAQPFSSKVAMATRILGAMPECSTDGKKSSVAKFTLQADKTFWVFTVVSGGYQATNHIETATKLAASQTHQSLADLHADHLGWWQKYWAKSHITIGEDLVEKFYYGALYVLGCSSREGSVPPGLAGPWHLHGPICWANKYTLDYNFESVWWGVYSANRPELALPYYDVILKLIPAGRQLAQEHGTKGILFGVNAHAWGGFTDTRTLNMKGNASLAALNFMWHYNYTQDESFLVNKAWPLLKELALFWEDNLVWDGRDSRWMICNSGAREGAKDTNAVTDLAYVKGLFKFLLDTSDVLEGKRSGDERIHISDAQKAKWRGYVTNLSRFPTIMFDGMQVFKEAENRNRMCLGGPGDNSKVLDHVFPGEAFSSSSDPEPLQIARNTVAALNPDDKKASWFQANCFPKIYTQAVRSGYPAEKVIANWNLLLAGRQPYDDRGDHVQLRANLTIVPPVHGLESVGAIEAVNSMLLQSYDQTIRVFPVWAKDRPASFVDLRAFGAFLVSSECQNGRVTHVGIKSEAGRLCRIANPWPGKACEVWANTSGPPEKVDFHVDDNLIYFPTEKGKQYQLRSL